MWAGSMPDRGLVSSERPPPVSDVEVIQWERGRDERRPITAGIVGGSGSDRYTADDWPPVKVTGLEANRRRAVGGARPDCYTGRPLFRGKYLARKKYQCRRPALPGSCGRPGGSFSSLHRRPGPLQPPPHCQQQRYLPPYLKKNNILRLFLSYSEQRFPRCIKKEQQGGGGQCPKKRSPLPSSRSPGRPRC